MSSEASCRSLAVGSRSGRGAGRSLGCRLAPACALLFAVFSGCTSEPPRTLRFVIDTDLAIPTQVDLIKVTVSASRTESGNLCRPWPREVRLQRRSDLPASIAVEIGAQYASWAIIRVQAFYEGVEVAPLRQDIVRAWPSSGSLDVAIFLAAACTTSGCGPGDQCVDGTCATLPPPPGILDDCTRIDQGVPCDRAAEVLDAAACDASDGEETTDGDDALSGPLSFAPGAAVLVDDLASPLGDLDRTPAGTLLVATQGIEPVPGVRPGGNIQVARSDDAGATWTTRSLGNAGGLETYQGRLFRITSELVGVAGSQGTDTPYDTFLRTSSDDGRTFDTPWTNVSLSPDITGEGNFLVTETPGGWFLAAFSGGDTLFYRRSADLDSWTTTTRVSLAAAAPVGGRFGTATDGTSIFLVAPTQDGAIQTLVSSDDGASFWLLSTSPAAAQFHGLDLYLDSAAGSFYACGVASDVAYANDQVYVFDSRDLGETWSTGVPYLDHLAISPRSVTSCHVDGSGVYVAYQDFRSGKITIILPGDPIRCGNGVREPGEECDGGDLGRNNCVSLGRGWGTLLCTGSCRLDPSSCPDPHGYASCASFSSIFDGVYTIDPDDIGPNPAFPVYCAGMDSGTPREYLELPSTAPGANISRYVGNPSSQEATCTYSKVRIADLMAMRIDSSDQSFASCTGTSAIFGSVHWGVAASCSSAVDGTMNLDLTGTPFVLAYDRGVVWEARGWVQRGEITRDEGPGRIVEATGGGFCGGMAVVEPPGLLLSFAE